MSTALAESTINGKEEIAHILRMRIRPFANQPRQYFDQQKLQELADSIAEVGQVTPVLVCALGGGVSGFDYELIDGQRRWHACEIAGVEMMRAVVIFVRDADHQFLLSSVANFGRVDHTPLETARAIQHFRNREMTVERIAKMFARSPAWVYTHLKLLKLHPDAQAMMSPHLPEEQRLSFQVALLLSDLSADLHVEMATTVIEGEMKLKQARHYIFHRAQRMGITVGSSERTPRSDYRIFQGFMGRFRRELEMFLSMPLSFFKSMFQHRPVDDHTMVVQKLEECLEQLQLLLRMLKKSGKE